MTITILHLLHKFGFGGTERVVANLLNHSNNGIINYISSFIKHDEEFLNEICLKQNVFCLDKKRGNDPSAPFKIVSFCKKNKVDIIHSLGWGTYAEGLFAAKIMLGIPFIFSYRGKTMEDTIGIPRRRIIAQRFFSHFSDRILTPSQISRNEYSKEIGIRPETISVIYNGVDTNRFIPDQKTRGRMGHEFGLSPDDIVIGTVGRLDPVKNIDSLVRGFAGLKTSFCDNCKLLIIGDGPEREKNQKMIDSCGIGARVILTGMRRDIPDLMNLMDIYVQPSKYEGIPNSVLEAMASSLPVIATNVGGVSEIVAHGESGFLYKPADQAQLLDFLTLLIKDKTKRDRMGAMGRSRAVSLFSIEKMVQTYTETYKLILNRSN